MFFNLSDFSPFIQLLVGSVFFVYYYDSKHEEPFVEEMRNTKKAIENLLQRFQTNGCSLTYKNNISQKDKIYRLKIISLVLILFGCLLLLYASIVNSIPNDIAGCQCCYSYKSVSFNLFYLLSIAIPSLTVLAFLICVLIRYGKAWKNLKIWSELIFWIMILSFVVFFILGMFFYFPSPTILVNTFHTLALFDCVFWIGIRYGKSWYLRKRLSNSYFRLLKLFFKSIVKVGNSEDNIAKMFNSNITSGLNDKRKKELWNYIGILVIKYMQSDNKGNFSTTAEAIEKVKEDIENDIKKELDKLNKLDIPDWQDQPKSCCSFCPHAINQTK